MKKCYEICGLYDNCSRCNARRKRTEDRVNNPAYRDLRNELIRFSKAVLTNNWVNSENKRKANSILKYWSARIGCSLVEFKMDKRELSNILTEAINLKKLDAEMKSH